MYHTTTTQKIRRTLDCAELPDCDALKTRLIDRRTTVVLIAKCERMGDFLGSYFAEGDETQLTQDIELHAKEQPAAIVNFNQIGHDAEEIQKWDAIDDSLSVLNDDGDDDFSPVAVASMNSFDPASTVTVPLTVKARTMPNKSDCKLKKAIKRLKQITVVPEAIKPKVDGSLQEEMKHVANAKRKKEAGVDFSATNSGKDHDK